MRTSSRIAIVVVLLLAAALAVAAALGAAWYRKPLSLRHSPYDFEVRSGASLGSVARALAADGVVPHAVLLTLLARVKRVDRTIKAGSYEIEQGITLPGLLAKLTQGDVTQTAITIVEGTTFAELKRALDDNPDVAHQLDGLSDGELLARLGASEPAPEGLFFPDTYYFAAGSSDLAVLKRAYRALHARLDAAWSRRTPGLPLASPYEALILASLVEKETGRAADRPLVASVFINRLARGMRLQTDPAVIYGIGERFDGNLRKRDLEADSPYNTYLRTGLPPTPIALPSQASLDVVVNPPTTPYLYFVSRGDGTSEFSANLIEHNRAVSKYQRGGR
ncbi:MAG TPA: endolytic transglycosylase MltG [Casimicrobiaceae bacterium]|nr:endolytic transglycosylase MltG [Casimicrobiaceae bacterium]